MSYLLSAVVVSDIWVKKSGFRKKTKNFESSGGDLMFISRDLVTWSWQKNSGCSYYAYIELRRTNSLIWIWVQLARAPTRAIIIHPNQIYRISSTSRAPTKYFSTVMANHVYMVESAYLWSRFELICRIRISCCNCMHQSPPPPPQHLWRLGNEDETE